MAQQKSWWVPSGRPYSVTPGGCPLAPPPPHDCTLLSVPGCLPHWSPGSPPPPCSLPGLDCWSIYNWFSASLSHHCIEPSQLPSLFVHLSSSAVGPAPHHHAFLSRNLGSSSSIFLSACGWSWRPLPEHPGARCCRDAHTHGANEMRPPWAQGG